MPIIDIQRRLAPAGEIRPGHQVPTGGVRKDGKPATRPEKLEHWRFTSRNRAALEALANAYGGTVGKWEGAPTGDEWELFSNANEIDVVLPPESIAFSQWNELWSGGGCKRRCDGVTEVLTEKPCLCDPDNPDCKPMTRLSLMLAGVRTTGLWRVVSTGHNAKAELAGAMDLADIITKATGRSVLPAKLRLEHRKQVRDGKTKQFVVPTLDYNIDIAELALMSGTRAELGSPSFQPVPVDDMPEAPGSSTAAQLAAVDNPAAKPRRANSAEPIRPTGLKPRPVTTSAGAGPSTEERGSPLSASDAESDPDSSTGSLNEDSPAELFAGRENGVFHSRQGAEGYPPEEAPAPSAAYKGETGEVADDFTLIALRNQIAKLPVEAKAEVMVEWRKRDLGSVKEGAKNPLLMSQAEDAQDIVDAIEKEFAS